MESAEQRDVSLQKVAGVIQPEGKKPIPLSEELKQIGVDATHIAGSTFDELMSGQGMGTRDRIASRNPFRLAWERAKKLKKWK